MTNGKSNKRQRQKEQRRARIEEEIRQYKARRRKRMTINLTILSVVVAGIAFLVFDPLKGSDSDSKDDSKSTASGCKTNAPPKGNTETTSEPPAMTIDKAKTYVAVMETSCGTIEIELADDTSPNTVNSFVFLARQGFYDGLVFHRIVKDFAVQGGDPKGDGTGGPNYKTVDAPPAGFKYEEGVVAMAKGGQEPPGTAGSQFFLVPGPGAATLPADYGVLGKVIKGDDALAKLNEIETTDGGGGEKSKPVNPVYIIKITIRES
ncbi:MAG TPA: peptidylprolyl isomerase [Actinomycetota bacterium]|nr:peptidylprolyl isomerase [Actinomycetota bacterium]